MNNPSPAIIATFYQPAVLGGGTLDTTPGTPAQRVLRPDGPPIRLQWPALDLDRLPPYTRIRVTVGVPGERSGAQSGGTFAIEAFLPGSADGADGGDLPLRLFDIRYPVSGQTFEITIDAGIAQQAARVGLGLRLRPTEPGQALAIWSGEGEGVGAYQAPHMACALEVAPLDALYAQLLTASPVFPTEADPALLYTGAHLHSLLDLADAGIYDRNVAIHACRQRIGAFETAHTDPILTLLGGALLARIQPQQATGAPLPIWVSDRLEKPGSGLLNAEDAYALAYPLALIARWSGRADVAGFAIRTLEALRVGLWRADTGATPAFFGRLAEDFYRPDDARALGWYALGLARSLVALADQAPIGPADAATYAGLQAHFQTVIRFILDQQTAAGLWSADLTDHKTPLDTFGSAALMAAIVIGYTHRLTAQRYAREASVGVTLLRQYLTPDGLLPGALQARPGGDLLIDDYSVISSTGMALFAQALAPSRALR